MARKPKIFCPIRFSHSEPSDDTNEVLGKYKKLPAAYEIINSTSALQSPVLDSLQLT